MDEISQNIPHSFQWRKLKEQIMLAYIHRKRFCLLSWTIYLVTLGHTGITWHFSYTSAELLKKLMTRGRWWNSLHNANKVESAEKTPGKSFNRCLKQRAILWFSQTSQLPNGRTCFNSRFKQDCSPALTFIITIPKNRPFFKETFTSCRYCTCSRLQGCFDHWGDFQQVRWSALFQCNSQKYDSDAQRSNIRPFAQLMKCHVFLHYAAYTFPYIMMQKTVSWCTHS